MQEQQLEAVVEEQFKDAHIHGPPPKFRSEKHAQLAVLPKEENEKDQEQEDILEEGPPRKLCRMSLIPPEAEEKEEEEESAEDDGLSLLYISEPPRPY